MKRLLTILFPFMASAQQTFITEAKDTVIITPRVITTNDFIVKPYKPPISLKGFFISAVGNDANNGTSIATPWRTIAKVNGRTFLPGDNILFRRGDTWREQITIRSSGTAGKPITVGAYGTGEKPIITGFTTVTAWVNLGGNLWESTSAVSTLTTCNIVVIGGVNIPMGRLPNTGYLTYQSHSGTTSITSSSLSGTPNWTGAEVVIKTVPWILDRSVISSQSSGAINFPAITHTPTDGFGFFLQNDVRTLDQQNEWYFNPSTKKLRIYRTSSPGSVLASSVDQLITVASDYITIDNISFPGANKNAIFCSSTAKFLTVQNCSINFSGMCGIDLANLSGATITGCTIENSNNIAIRLEDTDPNATITGNTIHNTGIIPGAGRSGFSGYSAILCVKPGSGLTAQYNSIINTGYMGINFSGSSVLIKNNFIDSFCTILNDGGGIYTQDVTYTDRVIDGNIVLNGIGNNQGVVSTDLTPQGIYIDDGGANVTISNNTVAHINASGIFLNGASNINILNNTVYDIRGLGFSRASISFSRGGPINIRNLSIKGNIFFQKDVNKDCWFFYSSDGNDADLLQYGIADSNYYLRPIDNDDVFRIRSTQHGFPGATYTLAQWKTFSGKETNSKTSSTTISSVTDLRFEYNATQSAVVIPLPFNYIDARGVQYNGTITLQPYTSAVLMKKIN